MGCFTGAAHYNRRFLSEFLYYTKMQEKDPDGFWDMFVPGLCSRRFDFELVQCPRHDTDVFLCFKFLRRRKEDGVMDYCRIFRYPYVMYESYDRIFPELILLDSEETEN